MLELAVGSGMLLRGWRGGIFGSGCEPAFGIHAADLAQQSGSGRRSLFGRRSPQRWQRVGKRFRSLRERHTILRTTWSGDTRLYAAEIEFDDLRILRLG